MPRLEVMTSMGRQVFPLDADHLTVGRSPDCGVVLDSDGLASRRHAVFEPLDHGWCVRDLGSSNGTRVNGELVVGVRALRPGDEIRIGASLFLYDDSNANLDVTQRESHGLGSRPDRGEADALSEREREVLGLLAEGATDQEIAGQLFISVATVRSHLERIRDKTGYRRRPELTRFAIEQGISPPRP